MSTSANIPIREKSLNGEPPRGHRMWRGCHRCDASFILTAAGKTGLRGIWDDSYGMRWYCSQECFDKRLRAAGGGKP